MAEQQTQPTSKIENLIDGLPPTDIGNADRLVAYADGRIRWVDTWGAWIVFDEAEGHWSLDTNRARVTEFAKAAVTYGLFNDRTTAIIDGQKGWDPEVLITKMNELAKWGKLSSSAQKIEAMTRLARGVPGVMISHEEIDAKPYLLCVRNGTIELLTGQLRKHDPDDLLMKQAPVFYNPDAKSALWNACLERWQPNSEVRSYLQRICGTGIAGIPMEAVYINHGHGSNGKSKFYEAIGEALGDFKMEPDKTLLTVNKHEGHPTSVASLFGARMAVAAETTDGDRLNEASIKNLTGGDTLRARRMREDFWSFKPTHTLFLHTNYQPDIKGTNEAVWRRIRLIPWAVTIPLAERDERLSEKLGTEDAKSAILNWLIDGFLSYREIGTAEPAVITEATEAYRRDEDVFGSFLADRCTIGRGLKVPNTELTMALKAFCDERGDDYLSHIEVAKRMREAGFIYKKSKVGVAWSGVAVNHGERESAPDQDVGDGDDGSSVYQPRNTSLGEHTEQPSQPSPLPSLSELLADMQANYGDVMEAARKGENYPEEGEE